MSYADPRVGDGLHDGVDRLQYEDLQAARHIIGWCQNVKNVTGDKSDLIARMEWLADKRAILHDMLDRHA
ncbi:hypothetical protein GP486_006725 [Trichoglossum hirsutum]|uniref:Uncharacterized protein n=1 Tax=Trichoglossum hirsutum TaxID=265104 RepID=A0A9P8L7R5_9PEZI|nr:hypothetical protein GP486_006725 [Trichoglossum hirsutum]